MVRKLEFYGSYFADFYRNLDEKVKEKIQYVFELVKTVEKIPKKFFEHIEGTDGIYEIKIEYGGNIYRIFCIIEKGNVIVLFNAIMKKKNKTPKKDIDLAERLKKDYINKK